MKIYQYLLQGLLGSGGPIRVSDNHYEQKGIVLKSGPPMGFNNWARYQCNLNESLFTDTVDSMLERGLLDSGYEYINLDDCWPEKQRASDGSLVWDSEKFPNGLIWLGQYIKDRGFKFGIYSDAGRTTCAAYPSSYDYEKIDEKTFRSWGVQYLKLDGCNVPNPDGVSTAKSYIVLYERWHDILSKGGKDPILFSESAPAYFCDDPCLDAWYEVMDSMPASGELARHSWDIANYGSLESHWDSLIKNYEAHILLARYQKPGFYNDPDFLIPDDYKLTMEERKTQFALWCSFSSPLIISADIPTLDDEAIQFLTNQDLIDIDKDELALQATLVSRDSSLDIFSKTLSNGDRLLTVFNTADNSVDRNIPLVHLGLNGSESCYYSIKNLWTKEYSKISSFLEISDLPSHGSAVYRVAPKGCKHIVDTGAIFISKAILKKYCLDSRTLSFAECNGSESQIYQFNENGSGFIRSLDGGKCLDVDKNVLTYSHCSERSKWTYRSNGSVINTNSGKCLTAGQNNEAIVASCGRFQESQILALATMPF